MEGVQKLDFLSLGLKNMGYRKNQSDHSPDVDLIYQKIQQAILAIPGHAIIFGDRINKSRAEHKSSVPRVVERGAELATYSIKSGAYRNERTYGLETLRHLPSPETVGVLGEFLADEWESPIPIQDDWIEQSLAQHAANTLDVMPIVKKPTARIEEATNPGVLIPDVKAWQQWFEQINAGNRTFRFEGDPTEYDLNGPAPSEKLQRIARGQKRDAERLAGRRKSSSASGSESAFIRLGQPSFIAGVGAALLLLAAAAWYWLKKK